MAVTPRCPLVERGLAGAPPPATWEGRINNVQTAVDFLGSEFIGPFEELRSLLVCALTGCEVHAALSSSRALPLEPWIAAFRSPW